MKILLVEDSRVLRDRIRRMVDAVPQAALVAETDSEDDALVQLDALLPDVAVIDLRLRVGSGLSVLEHIKAMHPGMITIVLTNYGQPEYREKCLALGADYFFDKTRDIEAFRVVLGELSQPRSDEVLPQ